ncbi:MAG: anthranilate synthase component I [Ruminococcus sp.]|nr:anthranilate synthase component I [Ruminococcus sp.]
MFYPEKDEARELLKKYKTVPFFYEMLIDSYTPIEMFRAFREKYKNCFFLESVDNKNQWGRYSFVGINPKMEIVIKNHLATVIDESGEKSERCDNPVSFLSDILEEYKSPRFPNRPKLTGGLMGYFAYDMVRYFEKTLVNPPKDDLNMPDANLFLYDEVVAYDHLSNKAVIILNVHSDEDYEEAYSRLNIRKDEIREILRSYKPTSSPKAKREKCEIEVTSNITKEQFIKNVEKAKDYIKMGDIFQVVPSQRFEVDNPPDSFDVYRMLRATNPSPYLYYFDHGDYAFAGASPEMLVSVFGNTVTTKPIAGTIKRGITDEEDLKNEKTLLGDPKELAEHTMLVDLGRNDIGKVSKFGTVEVHDPMHIERYSKVMHIVSDCTGEMADGKKPLDALAAVLPAGTLSGAPKVRAMEIIDELEPNKRGLYGGTVGYIAFDGSLDTCIAIRTVLFRNNKAYVQAGGGVVLDSIGENEYMESCNKALAVINAIKDAAEL